MGELIYRMTYGTTITGPQAKQQILAIINRLTSIFYTGSKRSINLASTKPMEVGYETQGGTEIRESPKALDEKLLKQLMISPHFKVRVYVDKFAVTFVHNQKKHSDNAFEAEVWGPFKEAMDKYLLNFMMAKDVIASSCIYDPTESRATRIRDLMDSVVKKFFGDTMYRNERKIVLHKFDREKVYFHFFGHFFSINKMS